MRVTVIYSPEPRQVREWSVEVAAGADLATALQASGFQRDFPDVNLRAASLGVWGRKATLEQPLRQDDRVEVYRLLVVDPKVARRERFRKQGARAAGLFARKK